MARRSPNAAHLWTTIARVAVCAMLVGIATDLAGWKVGTYVFGVAFLALMLSLQYP